MPEIIEAHRITGEDCFMVRIVVEDMAQLEVAIDTLAGVDPVSWIPILWNRVRHVSPSAARQAACSWR
jgi:Lrp/AsnC family leucine-responsive transcriptional regulator